MAYLSEFDLVRFGFKSVGNNVKISAKASIYDCEYIEIGDNSRVDDFCVISGRIKLGKNVHIAAQCLLAGAVAGIHMDDFSGLAYGVKVFSQTDDYSGQSMTNPTVPAVYKKELAAAVYIGRHVIVGTSSVVFPGVVLAEGCSIGAMSMVRKSTQAWGVYCGQPAKRIKDRSNNLLELEKKYFNDTQFPD